MIRLALSSEASPWLAALGTFVLHSTLFFAVVWGLCRLFLRRQPVAASHAWRLALVLPILSTAAVLALPPRLALFTAQVETGGPLTLALSPADRGKGTGADRREGTAMGMAERGVGPVAVRESGVDEGLTAPVRSGAGLPWWLWLAGLIALGRLGLLAGRLVRFRGGLRGRAVVEVGTARERLDTLCVHAGLAPVRLTVSPRVSVPMALGLTRAEICLPFQALEGLTPAELDAVLAHELAHLERADNGWLTLASVLEAILFFQPLVAAVRRRLQDSAELSCDERAVELTGSARALARSLAEVAAWNLGGEPAVPVSAMAHRGGLLLRRVQSLLADEPATRLGTGRMRLLLGGLAALAVFLPGLGGHGGRDGGAVTPVLVATAEAAPRVPAQIPKATAAANRFLAPPAPASDDSDQVTYPDAFDHRGAWSQDSWPPMPNVPLPPLEGLAPLADLVNGVVNGVVPRALEAAGRLGPLASREATLDMRLQALEQRRTAGRASADEVAEIGRVRGQLAEARKQRQLAEKDLERDMEAWGSKFERGPGRDFEGRMEAWGERMEKWGEEYGRQMERWGEEYGKQWERFGEELDWRLREPRRPRAVRTPSVRQVQPRLPHRTGPSDRDLIPRPRRPPPARAD
jgi:hypothetical protein